jgi:hypothetical protein
LRETLGRLARSHLLAQHALPEGAVRLARFLEEVLARKPALLARLAEEREEPTRLGAFVAETRRAARELGLLSVRLELRPLFEPIAREGA